MPSTSFFENLYPVTRKIVHPSIMADHGFQFYANASELKRKSISEFEKKLVELDMRHILSGVGYPKTNGNLERLHGEIQHKLS